MNVAHFDLPKETSPETLLSCMRVEKLSSYAGPEVVGPAHIGDAGIDLYATETVCIGSGEWQLVRCGIKIALPKDTEGQIRPKSGKANQGIVVLNSPGTIDEGYRGEVMVLVQNVNLMKVDDWMNLNSYLVQQPYTTGVEYVTKWIADCLDAKEVIINRGDKIAQLVITKYERPQVVYTEVLEDTLRGADGFGSTG